MEIKWQRVVRNDSNSFCLGNRQMVMLVINIKHNRKSKFGEQQIGMAGLRTNLLFNLSSVGCTSGDVHYPVGSSLDLSTAISKFK